MSNSDDLRTMWQKRVDPDFAIDKTIKPDSEQAAPKFTPNVRLGEFVISRDPDNPLEDAHYTILSLLGRGGMGEVYLARQHSTDREVALKLILPDKKDSDDKVAAFLAEAVVTANLDHPNILPVYDLGRDQNGTAFYSMKRITGRSWLELLTEKTQKENVEILLRVCDAVEYAHDQGLIHRDIKPENVMVGNYGEVVLLDWGLAASFAETAFDKAEPLSTGSSFGGTAAYMAPEMAVCDSSRLGPASDVYLLGATLYEIVAGDAPHEGGDIYETLRAARDNVIQPTDIKGELVEIALEAMSTLPEDRYASVRDFRNAITNCMTHFESIELDASARKSLNRGYETGDYAYFAQAQFGFREALKQWDGNKDAKSGLDEAVLAYADLATEKGDLDLAESLLDPENPEHSVLLERVERLQSSRRAKHRTVKILIFSSLGLLLTIVVVLATAFQLLSAEREKAEKAKDAALDAKEAALQSSEKAKAEEAKAKRLLEAVEKERDNTKMALAKLENEKKKVEAAKSESKSAKESLSEEKTRLSRIVAPKYLKEALAHYERCRWKDAATRLKLALELNDTLHDACVLKAKLDLASLKLREAKKELSKCSTAPEYLSQIIDEYLQKTRSRNFKFDIATLLELVNDLSDADPQLLKCLFKVRSDAEVVRKRMQCVRKALLKANPKLKKINMRYHLNSDEEFFLNLALNPELTDLTPLVNLPIRRLDLNHTGVADLAPLLKVRGLKRLNIDETSVRDLDVLEKLNLKAHPNDWMDRYVFLNTFNRDAYVSLSFDKSSLRKRGKGWADFASDTRRNACGRLYGEFEFVKAALEEGVEMPMNASVTLKGRRIIVGDGITVSFFFKRVGSATTINLIDLKRDLEFNSGTASMSLRFDDATLPELSEIDDNWHFALVSIDEKTVSYKVDEKLLKSFAVGKLIRLKLKRPNNRNLNFKSARHLQIQPSVLRTESNPVMIDEFSIMPGQVDEMEAHAYFNYIKRKIPRSTKRK